MHAKSRSGSEVFLWVESVDDCDNESDQEPKKKSKKPMGSCKWEEEDDVDVIYSELYSKQEDTYSIPQLRLWARMRI